MNQERLKLIVHNLELIVNSLKEEMREESVFYNHEEISSYIESDVDEYYVEEETNV